MASPYDPNDPNYNPGDPHNPSTAAPWWQGPPPAGYTGQWPPPLPPGATYGPNPGQINYPPGTPSGFTDDYNNPYGPNNPNPQYNPNNFTPKTPTPPPPPVVAPPVDPTKPNPTTGTPTPTGMTQDQFVAAAKQYYQSKWNTALTDPVMAQAKTDLGSTTDPNYRYSDADLGKTKAWIDSHNPGGGTGPTKTTAPDPNNGPTFNGPTVNTPAPFNAPPAFTYADFQAPTLQDVLNDPGYNTDLMRGVQGLEHSAAAKGVLNTGGTLAGVQQYGQQLGSAEYSNLFNRDLTTYQQNRQGALDSYNTNYQTQYKDPYTINYQTQYSDPFQANLALAQDKYQAQNTNWQTGLSYQQHTIDQNQYYNQHNIDQSQMYNWDNILLQYQKQQDDFNNKYRLLGLA